MKRLETHVVADNTSHQGVGFPSSRPCPDALDHETRRSRREFFTACHTYSWDMPAAIKVVMVDDSHGDRRLCRTLLEEALGTRLEFWEADAAQSGLETCRATAPDCILLEYRLPDMTGLEFLAGASIHRSGGRAGFGGGDTDRTRRWAAGDQRDACRRTGLPAEGSNH